MFETPPRKEVLLNLLNTHARARGTNLEFYTDKDGGINFHVVPSVADGWVTISVEEFENAKDLGELVAAKMAKAGL